MANKKLAEAKRLFKELVEALRTASFLEWVILLLFIYGASQAILDFIRLYNWIF